MDKEGLSPLIYTAPDLGLKAANGSTSLMFEGFTVYVPLLYFFILSLVSNKRSIHLGLLPTMAVRSESFSAKHIAPFLIATKFI